MIEDIRNINTCTDRLIVIHYPCNAGGKFLMNCLGLSSGFVLQDHNLAKQNIFGGLSTAKKLNILLYLLGNISDAWNDLKLGCGELFGDDEFKYCSYTNGYNLRHCRFWPVIYHLTRGDHYFGCVTHTQSELKHTLEAWPRARVILLRDFDSFLERYRPNSISPIWSKVRGVDWPQTPPASLDQFFLIPTCIRQELENRDLTDLIIKDLLWEQDLHEDKKQQEETLQDLVKDRLLTTWCTSWILKESDLLENLSNLYAQLGLHDFDPKSIANFRQKYLAVLDQILMYKKNC